MAMSKKFEYRGFTFNIGVEFNTKVEKRINGDRWHTITTNCMDFDNYYKKTEVLDKYLEHSVKRAETLAKLHIDKKKDNAPVEDARLTALGFK